MSKKSNKRKENKDESFAIFAVGSVEFINNYNILLQNVAESISPSLAESLEYKCVNKDCCTQLSKLINDLTHLHSKIENIVEERHNALQELEKKKKIVEEQQRILLNCTLCYTQNELVIVLASKLNFPIPLINLVVNYSHETKLDICHVFNLEFEFEEDDDTYEYIYNNIYYYFSGSNKLCLISTNTGEYIKEFSLFSNRIFGPDHYFHNDYLCFINAYSTIEYDMDNMSTLSITNICSINLTNHNIKFDFSLETKILIGGEVIQWIIDELHGIMYIYKKFNNACHIQKLHLPDITLSDSIKLDLTCDPTNMLFHNDHIYFLCVNKKNNLIIFSLDTNKLHITNKFVILESEIIRKYFSSYKSWKKTSKSKKGNKYSKDKKQTTDFDAEPDIVDFSDTKKRRKNKKYSSDDIIRYKSFSFKSNLELQILLYFHDYDKYAYITYNIQKQDIVSSYFLPELYSDLVKVIHNGSHSMYYRVKSDSHKIVEVRECVC